MPTGDDSNELEEIRKSLSSELQSVKADLSPSAMDLPSADEFITGVMKPRPQKSEQKSAETLPSASEILASLAPPTPPSAAAPAASAPPPASPARPPLQPSARDSLTLAKASSFFSSAAASPLPRTDTKAVAKAMAALQEKVKKLLSEKEDLTAQLATLQSQHAATQEAFDSQSSKLASEIAAARATASSEVRATLASSGAQHLALHKELDYVRDLAQTAETEKRSAQVSVVAMERQLAGLRFDAETRIHELEARSKSATQAEAVAQARSRELEAELEALRTKHEEQSTQKRRVDEALRSVLAINETLLTRISAVDGPRALHTPGQRAGILRPKDFGGNELDVDAVAGSWTLPGCGVRAKPTGGCYDTGLADRARLSKHVAMQHAAAAAGAAQRPTASTGQWAATAATVRPSPASSSAAAPSAPTSIPASPPSPIPKQAGQQHPSPRSVRAEATPEAAEEALHSAFNAAAAAHAVAAQAPVADAVPKADASAADALRAAATGSALPTRCNWEDCANSVGAASSYKLPHDLFAAGAAARRKHAAFCDAPLGSHMIAPSEQRAGTGTSAGGVERPTLASARRSAQAEAAHVSRAARGHDGHTDATFSGRPSARPSPRDQPCLRGDTPSRWARGDLENLRSSSLGALRATVRSATHAANSAAAAAGMKRGEVEQLTRRGVVSARSGPRASSAPRDRGAVPTDRAKPVPKRALDVLGRESVSEAVDGELNGASAQIVGVIRSVETELGELNLQYQRSVAELRAPQASGEEEHAHARLRDLVLQMEQKSAQLAALRRTHTVMTDHLSGVRDELLATRGALEEAAETAAARYHRIRKLELDQQRAGTGF